MAHGSLRQMRRYTDKVFAKEARLARMSDGRRDPILPLAAVLATWQWGLIRQTPSTEQIGDLLRDRRWRARLGLQPQAGGSADRAAEVLDSLAIEEWHEMMLEDFFLARVSEVVDPAMLEKPPDNAGHSDVFAHASNPRTQTANSADKQINLHARLRCLVQQTNGALVHESVHLEDQVSTLAPVLMIDLALNHPF